LHGYAWGLIPVLTAPRLPREKAGSWVLNPSARIKIAHAWKWLASKERKLGDPKWHKHREIPFPMDLQKAIKGLWAVNGRHEFVFAREDGTQPGPDWIRDGETGGIAGGIVTMISHFHCFLRILTTLGKMDFA
jgi:hypothetical protein